MLHDGLLDAYEGYHMGETGEVVADRFAITRADADALAVASHRKAAEAEDAGLFADEIVAVEVARPGGRGTTLVSHDEGIRHDATADSLAKLRAAFRKDGVVTAGNASQISDGASALIVMSRAEADRRRLEPLARVVASDSFAMAPKLVMEAPIGSVRRLLEKTALRIDDVDLFEHNEAFATASCAVAKDLGVPADRFNVHGGA